MIENSPWFQQLTSVYPRLSEDMQRHSSLASQVADQFAEYLRQEDRLAYFDNVDENLLLSADLMGGFANVGTALLDDPDSDPSMARNHTVLGGYLIRGSLQPSWKEEKTKDLRDAIAQSCLYHHERWDGTGYPNGLKGNEIPFFARMVAICDTYATLQQEDNLSKEQRLEKIAMGADNRFDPILTELFCCSKGMSQERCRELRKKAAETYPSQLAPVSTPSEKETDKEETLEDKEQEPVKKKSVWSDVVFYFFLVIAAVAIFFFVSGATSEGPRSFAGFSAFTVLTGSMRDEIPQGSLVVTRHVEPSSLQVGDDITYMISQTATITHRIISIKENYQNTGYRYFQTQGTMNKNPDKELVPEVNIVGKVIFHSYPLGQAVTFIQQNWPIVIFLVVVACALFFALKRILR